MKTQMIPWRSEKIYRGLQNASRKISITYVELFRSVLLINYGTKRKGCYVGREIFYFII